ncbi:MAG: S1 RNA-binding domain-containing protein, partial [Candidatus Adiutrix sp.]|nr:S1 RNA-binding domain-containing protein [Candidatus Adiutrix sp.]
MENFNNRDNDTTRDDLTALSPSENGGEHAPAGGEGLDMALLFEESFKTLAEGEVLKGQVVQIGKEFVMLDVGGKSEGRISLQEFLDPDGNLTVKVGDQVEALLMRVDDEDGEMILSKDKAAKIKVWEEITRIHNDELTIKGVVTARVKGGLSVDIGVNAFLPGSQVDSRPIKNLESLVGQTFDFKVLKYNKRRGNVVLSRRAILEVEREALKRQTL